MDGARPCDPDQPDITGRSRALLSARTRPAVAAQLNMRRYVWGLTPVVRLKRSRKVVGEPKPTWAPRLVPGASGRVG